MMIDVVIVSTSRFQKFGSVKRPEMAEDISGMEVLKTIGAAGYDYTYQLLPDGVLPLRDVVLSTKADAVVISGGTGLAPKDLTIEAIGPLFEKNMPGFGEIFRMKSLDEVGTRAILTRASAGLIGTVPVFCLPGSPSAARLGTELVLAELEHILKHIFE